MARDGQGNYNPPLNNWNPAVDGNEADPASWNQLLADLVAALSQSVSADGQTMLTGNLKMGGNTLQGMGAPSANGQALRRDQLIKGPNIPSSATVNIPNEGSVFEVTGTETINQMSGAFDGRMVVLVFQDELTIKHGPNLQLPNATDITTKAGDAFVFYRKSSSEWAALYGTAATRDVGTGPDDVPTNGLIFATFAEISALTEDQGPLICIDNHDILYLWDTDSEAYKPVSATESKSGTVRFSTTEQAQGLTDDEVAVTPKKLGDALDATALGRGQTWQDVTTSRSASTTYTNTTGRPIVVRVTCNSTTTSFNAQLFVDGERVDDVTFSYGSGSITSRSTLIAIVPPGETYSFEYAGGSWTRWMELR